ncbi:MAG TPA: helix-turn-helix domain-containing protein [Acidimicrobiia bacterium]|nr:helix-turn-helix domain-containing protein [Acidimicrobiia bacterium]
MARDLTFADHGDLLTPAEAARKLGVTPNTVTRWSRAGKISAIQTMGGHRRFRRSEIERVQREANLFSANPF